MGTLCLTEVLLISGFLLMRKLCACGHLRGALVVLRKTSIVGEEEEKVEEEKGLSAHFEIPSNPR